VSRRRSRNQKRSRRTGIEKKIAEPISNEEVLDSSEPQMDAQQLIETADVERPQKIEQESSELEPVVQDSPEPQIETKADNADTPVDEEPQATVQETEETQESEEQITTPPQPKLSLRLKSDPGNSASSPMPTIDESTVYTGDILRQVREHRGITLRTISNITRIGVPSLMAVEEERYEDLPNARIYVLGFVRCLSHEIGLDREVAAKSYIGRWQAWWDERSEEDRRSYR